MSNIILMQDLIDSKERREQELQFYKEKLKDLSTKISFLEQDVKLTNTIIKMIEDGDVTEV